MWLFILKNVISQSNLTSNFSKPPISLSFSQNPTFTTKKPTEDICETLDPPITLIPPDIYPEVEIRPPYKLSITTRDYQRIRYWQTTRSSVLVPCILPGANLLLKLEGMLPFQWFVIQVDNDSGAFKQQNPGISIKSCKYKNDTVISERLGLRQRYLVQLRGANELSKP